MEKLCLCKYGIDVKHADIPHPVPVPHFFNHRHAMRIEWSTRFDKYINVMVVKTLLSLLGV